mmetsp:Transcript_7895/g.14470  ORF Transcript_7895/g.14470 Transcript_7895/m.14470 type:complete len:96 (+) Transcript_7895:2-289(+)
MHRHYYRKLHQMRTVNRNHTLAACPLKHCSSRCCALRAAAVQPRELGKPAGPGQLGRRSAAGRRPAVAVRSLAEDPHSLASFLLTSAGIACHCRH